jgi:hypothetical protein
MNAARKESGPRVTVGYYGDSDSLGGKSQATMHVYYHFALPVNTLPHQELVYRARRSDVHAYRGPHILGLKKPRLQSDKAEELVG